MTFAGDSERYIVYVFNECASWACHMTCHMMYLSHDVSVT